jgi:transposase
MTPRKTKTLRMPPSPEPWQVAHPHAAGIDVHQATHWVAVPPDHAPPPPADHPADLPPYVRTFGTCTADLEALADWLKTCGVTTVALEATGVYGMPLFEVLERRGFVSSQ